MSKSETAVFMDNFYSALRMLGGNPGGSVLELRQGDGAFSTGLPFAGENYAIFDTSPAPEELCGVLDLYEKRDLPFIALQLPILQEELASELERRRIFSRATYLAMSIRNFPAKTDKDPLVKKVCTDREAERWAEAAWTGFEGELPVPRAYAVFSRYLFRCPANSLFFLEREGHPALLRPAPFDGKELRPLLFCYKARGKERGPGGKAYGFIERVRFRSF